MKNTHLAQVITCFEHQRLSRDVFLHQQDFEYLIKHELPCFNVGVKQGKTYLQVRHYLAKILLPSGATIEILPKVNAICTNAIFATQSVLINTQASKQSNIHSIRVNSEQKEIQFAREWVGNMLADIAQYNLQKIIPAIDLSAAIDKSNNFDSSFTHLLHLPLDNISTTHNTGINNSDPWYEWLLNTACEKIAAAENILPNKYHTRSQNHPQARGKLNLSEQFKSNWHRPHYLYSEQAFFENDDRLKRFLATGWQQLLCLNDTKATQSKNNVFSGIKTLPINRWQMIYQALQRSKKTWRDQFNPVQLNVLTEALAWCWWILSNISAPVSNWRMSDPAENISQNLPYPALMINMNHAFEAWVLSRLEAWVTKNMAGCQLIVQPSFNWLLHARKTSDSVEASLNSVIQKLNPDAYIKSATGQVTHVIDIKYKSINKVQDINGSDWHQLFVYQNHLNAENAWLIFPMTLGFNKRIEVSGGALDKKMSAIPFNLSQRDIEDTE